MASKSKENPYKLRIGNKTRVLNVLRRVFMVRFMERFLVNMTTGKKVTDLWVRFVPPSYLYRKGTVREVEREGIHYRLDLSDGPAHAVFFGFLEEAQIELLRLARNAEVIFDVGANIGSVSLKLAKVSPQAQIFSFEPDRVNFVRAQTNINLNGYVNISLINKGLGRVSGTEKLYRVDDTNAGMNRILNQDNSLRHPDFESEEIEITSLDDFIRDNGISRVDLIKLDVEGYELNVLVGAKKLLNEFRPTLFVELDDNNLREHSGSAKELVSFLEGLGYGVYSAENKRRLDTFSEFENCHLDIVCTQL